MWSAIKLETTVFYILFLYFTEAEDTTFIQRHLIRQTQQNAFL